MSSQALLVCSSVSTTAAPPILVVGSLNVDITVPVHRLPERGETITAREPSTSIAVGKRTRLSCSALCSACQEGRPGWAPGRIQDFLLHHVSSNFGSPPTGGKGANQAVAAARLGAAVSFVGRFGNDSYAAWLGEHRLAGRAAGMIALHAHGVSIVPQWRPPPAGFTCCCQLTF